MNKSTDPLISVIIPTYHRPEGIFNAVNSVLNQKNAPAFEIIVLDNDTNGSAQNICAKLSEKAHNMGIDFTYDIEHAAGVANARNSAVKIARGKFVAFLDDDETAFEDWLQNLYKAWNETKAWVVFGPIEAVLEDGAEEPKEYFKSFFERRLDGETRIITNTYGCGNSFIEVAKVFVKNPPFSLETNETGGEDDYLWGDVRARNGNFAFAKDAWVYEHVPKERASWKYMTRRAFAFGHYVSAKYFNSKDKEYLKGIASMGRGCLQALLMLPLFLALALINHEKRAWAYDKMLRGFGKIFWFGDFKQKLYGEAGRKEKEKAAT